MTKLDEMARSFAHDWMSISPEQRRDKAACEGRMFNPIESMYKAGALAVLEMMKKRLWEDAPPKELGSWDGGNWLYQNLKKELGVE